MITGRTQVIAHLGYPTESFKAPMVYNPWFEAKSDKRRMTLHLCLAGGGCSTRSEPLGLEKSSFDHVRFSSCGRKGSPSAVLHDRLYITGIAGSRSASANPSAITFGCKNDGPPRLSESY